MKCTLAAVALALAACSGGPPGGGAGGHSGSTTSFTGSGGDAPASVTTLRVHYPAGAHALTMRGSTAPLSWDHGSALAPGVDDTWTLTLDATNAPLEVKPLLDDVTWSIGPNYRVTRGGTADIYPRFQQVVGQYHQDAPLDSQILGNTRGVWIYLPPTYLENARFRGPVLYMHDGQNLFDPAASFSGVTWRVAETMDAAALDGSIAEAIVVGIENTADRMNEYTPWADPTWNVGGKGDLYLKMIVEELRPRIDAAYRTLTGPEYTTLAGSSLGGLISAYAGVTRPDVFGAVGVLSPTTWWDGRKIIDTVKTIPQQPARARLVYVDSGDSGTLPGEPPNDDVLDTSDLADAYRGAGYQDSVTLLHVIQAGGTHDEAHWAQRLPGALAFLLGPRVP